LKAGALPPGRLEGLLAQLLYYGTLAAAGTIALGLAISVVSVPWGERIAAAGIALFILLPVIRVAVMLAFFLRTGDYPYGATAALVLFIICLSFFIGARYP
jgi:uncharacterized membrane protein